MVAGLRVLATAMSASAVDFGAHEQVERVVDVIRRQPVFALCLGLDELKSTHWPPSICSIRSSCPFMTSSALPVPRLDNLLADQLHDGTARASRKRFEAMTPADQQLLLEFLKTI